MINFYFLFAKAIIEPLHAVTDFRFMFVMFPRLCQHLRLRTTKVRQIWKIRGSDKEV